jgi:general L-amino acid transport system substrate-binding protein
MNVGSYRPSAVSKLAATRRTPSSANALAPIGYLTAFICAAFLSTTAEAATLDYVRSRGVLVCGVSDGVPGFSSQSAEGSWAGFDVDFCKAMATAVLGDPGKIKLVPTSTEDRFKLLQDGTVDILTRNTSWTVQREIDQQVVFPAVLYFDGQSFMVPRELGLTNPKQLSGAKICVLSGTTSETNVGAFFAASGLEVQLLKFAHPKEALEAYEAGKCDAHTGDRSALFGEMQTLSDPTRHMVLTEVISKEILGPVVRSSDRNWGDIVRWVLACLVNAEEVQLTRELLRKESVSTLTAEQTQLVANGGKLGVGLGLPATWVGDVIRAVGNYGELFDRNVGKGSPLGMVRGYNALWRNGGLMYAPPMR